MSSVLRKDSVLVTRFICVNDNATQSSAYLRQGPNSPLPYSSRYLPPKYTLFFFPSTSMLQTKTSKNANVKEDEKKRPGSAPLSGSITEDSRVYSVHVLRKSVHLFFV